jgi:putative peptidoglycan lipid II flippase
MLRANLVVASGTALSRLTGLARVLAFAYVIGQTSLADAYKLANETPNIVYDLLLGGVLSATLVPIFTSLGWGSDDCEDPAARRRSTEAVVTAAVAGVVIVTVLAVALAPWIFRLYSLSIGDGVDPEVFRSTGTTLARFFLIQILFYGLTGIANALLNSRRRFLAASWSPVASNLIIIISLLTLPGAGSRAWQLSEVATDGRLRLTLGLGATVGIATMAVIVVPAVRRSGVRLRPRLDLGDPAVRRLAAMSGWTLGFVLANQVALVVVRNLAEPGSSLASAYFDAFTFFVLPHGLLAVSVATTFQPELASAVAKRDRDAFAERFTTGLRAIIALTAPAAALIFVLRQPLISGLMERGRFDEVAVTNTTEALAGLSLGLVGFSVYLFSLRGYYAHHDTRTPFVLNVGENLANIVFALLLVGPLGVLGLGLAHSVAYALAAIAALLVLGTRVGRPLVGELVGTLWRVGLAALLAAEVAWVLNRVLDTSSPTASLLATATAGIGGLLAYLLGLILLRFSGARESLNRAVRRGRPDG